MYDDREIDNFIRQQDEKKREEMEAYDYDYHGIKDIRRRPKEKKDSWLYTILQIILYIIIGLVILRLLGLGNIGT